ncbi:MAG: peptidylprolyl isomerase [Gammaproteobacteria bacterium]|jgi:peptidylprolyl isomerase
MSTAEKGQTVRVHYTGTLEDGSQFDSSRGRDPLEFELGGNQVIPGFEAAIIGMSEGETQTITIASSEAYGARRQELVAEMPRDDIPDDISLQEGGQLQLRGEGGHPVRVTITEVREDVVVLDANHPLAGLDLTFEIELVEVL